MIDSILHGDYREILPRREEGSAELAVTALPDYPDQDSGQGQSEFDWLNQLYGVIRLLGNALRPGGFLAISAGDILCYPDEDLPRAAAQIPNRQNHVTRRMVLRAQAENPDASRVRLAEILGCSEQTIQRRLEDNNVRGGKTAPQTRVQLIGPILDEAARRTGLYLYDRRVWVRSPAWGNSRWHYQSYRAVDEFEHILVFTKPGPTLIDRSKLTDQEWREWGSRAVWFAPSVRRDHRLPERFPLLLARRLIRLLSAPGDLVVDPFLRSGTTAVAALIEKRHYLGIESDAGSVAVARQRIANAIATR